MVTALMNPPKESFACPTPTPSMLTACNGPWTSKRPMRTTNRDSQKPRPALETPDGASRNRHIHITGGTGPVAITVQDGQPRRRLVAVGDTRPFIEVPRQIDVEALASALNAILNGVEPADEVDGFTAVTAAAFAQGIDYERSMAGVA